ncbi:hypothetical protein EX30DRAFT_338851 [Ascodesmis nigricans]|uniref:Sas10 C-terminal domain-containing protein n=1 Tax=Ascodesmis nigricans TaxID=341454 RepID=A0A4S2N4X9_9PEZI|nr:hypothetical protein EX30DRAFT_338851 [Ascodesmis nigricans]
MGKKRRSRSAANTNSGPAGEPSAKHAAITSWEDVADSADEFHLERDKMALESVADLNSRRRHNDDFGDNEEEVMGLENYGFRESGSEDEDEDEEEEEEDLENEKGADGTNSDSDDEGRKEEEIEEGWGSSKKNYYGGHDSDLEADPAEEEEEARRLQSTHLAAMADEDFMFDNAEWGADGAEGTTETAEKSSAGKIIEALPTVLPTDPAARLKLLHSLHPEFEPLSKEFLSIQSVFPTLEAAARASKNPTDDPIVRKWKIASAYLGILSLYFGLMAGEERESVREHPIMDILVRCRQRWEGVKDLRVERIEERIMPTPPGSVEKQILRESGHLKTPLKTPTISKKRKPDELSSDEDELAEPTPIVKKKTKTKPSSTTNSTVDFSDLNSLLTSAITSKKPKKPPATQTPDSDNDFLEPTALSATEYATKESRRKNLRFHTSQIVSRSNKRTNAGINAGGDLDLPHKERRRERELRLQAEAARRRNEGADLDSRSPSPEPQAKKSEKSRFDQAIDAQEAAYLALLSGGAKEAKKKKEQQYKDAKAGLVTDTDEIDPKTGKRAITYQIQKNKGLTPHRKKEVRNPRVKKRNAYEKKKKKLSSTRAVYRGGLQGSYGGEATGIKKSVVKSVKFSS